MQKKSNTIWCKCPSPTAVRLANDIYYTYLQEESPTVRISLKRLCEVFGDADVMHVKISVAQIFEELNEPIALSDFHYRGKTIEWATVNFFQYVFCCENGNDYIDLEINELYLEALRRMEEDSYINFQ